MEPRAVAGLILAGVLALGLSACEYPGVPHPLAAPAQGQRSAGAGPAARAAPAAQPKSPQGGGVLQGRVQVIQKDFELDPDSLTVKAGAITFALKNEGRYTHDFRVEGQGVDEKGPKVGSGRTMEWQITLQPGAYRISCPVSNHADRGMTGTLEVVS